MSIKAIARKRAFTLVELLIVVIIIAVLAAIAIPKFTNSSLRSKESALRAELKMLRDGVELFKNDTTCYPYQLSDLQATSAPSNCYTISGGVVSTASVNASAWKGPYISSLDADPVDGGAFAYTTSGTSLGKIAPHVSGNDSTGVAYSTY